MKIVAVLAVQWGYPGDAVEPWFTINPYNRSGNRLIQLIGHFNFIVTNACSDIVYSASTQGTPNPAWLRANLRALKPSHLLLCGAVAQATFHRDMVAKGTRIVKLPHPAARTWSKASIAAAQHKIRRSLKGT